MSSPPSTDSALDRAVLAGRTQKMMIVIARTARTARAISPNQPPGTTLPAAPGSRASQCQMRCQMLISASSWRASRCAARRPMSGPPASLVAAAPAETGAAEVALVAIIRARQLTGGLAGYPPAVPPPG